MNESGVPEQPAQARPIKAQSAAIARAMASICNAERVCLGGMSGHGGFVHTFSASQGSHCTQTITSVRVPSASTVDTATLAVTRSSAVR